MKLTLFAPSGVAPSAPRVRMACKTLKSLGFDASLDPSATARHQRFAGDDATRLEAIHRVADQAPDVAMAVRGGYGLTRLLGSIRWPSLARAAEQGTRWVGYSDITALQLALLAHTGAPSWAGPCALDDFVPKADGQGPDEVTAACFQEAMSGELEAVGFRTEVGFDGLQTQGRLWGGNLAMVCSLLGTPHWPKIRRGILFLEDVAEHPYRVERMLLQLHQAGVLDAQRAVVLGHFTQYKASPLDCGYSLKTVVAHLRSQTQTPILTGLPFGHVPTKVSLPIGVPVALHVQGRDALLAWGHR